MRPYYYNHYSSNDLSSVRLHYYNTRYIPCTDDTFYCQMVFVLEYIILLLSFIAILIIIGYCLYILYKKIKHSCN